MSALSMPFVAASNPEKAFQEAIAAAGLTPPDTIIADGKIHRFATNGKRGDDAGWYILHLDNIPAGIFGSWREGHSQTWCSIGRTAQTPEQQKQYATLLKSMQNARSRAKKVEHDAAAEMARAIWAAAAPIEDAAAHGYLVKKGIQVHGARLTSFINARELCTPANHLSLALNRVGGLLVIPMTNATGEFRSLQFITADGTKRPFTGGEKQGCHYLISRPDSAV
jgi:putative DNA primase/helicase